MNPFALRILSLVAALLLAPLALHAETELRLSSLFGNHTVLQRDQTVPIWGWADPGEAITVEFGGQKKTGEVDATGKWLVRLDPMPASAEGRVLTVESALAQRKTTITDVLVGDVWLCSGQSNMHFQMKSVENAPKEVASMTAPAVRFFTVKQQFGQEPLADVIGAWKPVSPATAAACSAVACYFGTALNRHLEVPIGLLVSSVGGTRIESWMRSETLAATGESESLVEKWKDMSPDEFGKIGAAYSKFQYERDHAHPRYVREARENGSPAPPPPVAPKLRCHDCPGALHNGMIAPFESFAIRGVIWYQGESNAGQPKPYEKLFPAMIADWRRVWGKELPFLFVQLAPHRSIHPAFREAQHRIWQQTPHTAMVVTTDVGDANNIHPTRKRPVGERLALAARALCYGEKVEASGPVLQSMIVADGRAVLSFTHTGSGLMANGGELKGFTLAGADGKYVPARAVIDGATVVVTSAEIRSPFAVRYGWAMVPDGNLSNRDGLPAAPFRTDQPADRNGLPVPVPNSVK